MAEIWDAYLADGTLAGCDLVRDEPIAAGLYHLVTSILVRHEDGDCLLMHRDPSKPNYGGWYEATAGGSALKGEDPLSCAMRELREETGIARGTFSLLGRDSSQDTHYVTYLCVTDWDKTAITCQAGETDGFLWLDADSFADFLYSDACMPGQHRRLTQYLGLKGKPGTA